MCAAVRDVLSRFVAECSAACVRACVRAHDEHIFAHSHRSRVVVARFVTCDDVDLRQWQGSARPVLYNSRRDSGRDVH